MCVRARASVRASVYGCMCVRARAQACVRLSMGMRGCAFTALMITHGNKYSSPVIAWTIYPSRNEETCHSVFIIQYTQAVNRLLLTTTFTCSLG